MERIEGQDGMVALILDASDDADGAWFLTGQDRPYQLGLIDRPAGYEVSPHRHAAPTVPMEGDPVSVIVTDGRLRLSIEHDDVEYERAVTAGGAVIVFAGSMTVEADGEAEYAIVRRSADRG